MNINIERGKRVKECYEELGMKQIDFARKVGYSPQHINRVVKGERPLTQQAAFLFGEKLNVRPEYLLCEDDLKYKDTERENNTICYERFSFMRFLMELGCYGIVEILESPEHATGIRDSKGNTLQLMQKCILGTPDNKMYVCSKEQMDELCEDVVNYLFMRIEKGLLPKCSEITSEELSEDSALLSEERRYQFILGIRRVLQELPVKNKIPKYRNNSDTHEPTEEK